MKRPNAFLRPAWLAVLVLTTSAGAGCASSEAARRDQARAAREARHGAVHQATDSDSDDSSQMTVSGDEGTLNSQDVDTALHAHMGEILDCYRLGRKAPQHADARVLLRFFVDGKGEVDDVSILQSNIGNHAVERCLADIAVGVVFEPPTGHKATTFDYPFEFRSREVTAARQRQP
jgi:TonB family protein